MRDILQGLGVDPDDGRAIIEVWNKVDLLDEAAREAVVNSARRDGESQDAASRPIVVSALTGEGTPALLDRVEALVAAGRTMLDIDLSSSDGAGLAWLYETSDVISRVDDGDGTIRLSVRVAPERADQVRRRFGLAA